MSALEKTGGGVTGLRERKKEEKWQRIREAAWALFAERGFEGTTTRAICERAGIGEGTLFAYVADKEELLALLFIERIEPILGEAFAALPPPPLADQLVSIFSRFFDFYEQDPRLSRHLVKALLFLRGRGGERSTAFTLAFLAQLAGLAAQAKARGELRPGADEIVLAQSLFAVYFLTLSALLSGVMPREAIDLAFRRSLEQLVEGVLSASSPAFPEETPR